MALVYVPRPQTGLTESPPDWSFPTELKTEPMPLRPDEIAWLIRGGAESAERRRFEWRGIMGSMLFITSRTWRAQHRPERCFEVFGLSPNDSRTVLVTPFPVRFVSLGNRNGRGLLSATYWFSLLAAQPTTMEHAWADLSPERNRWILVTLCSTGCTIPRDECPGLEMVVRTHGVRSLEEIATMGKQLTLPHPSQPGESGWKTFVSNKAARPGLWPVLAWNTIFLAFMFWAWSYRPAEVLSGVRPATLRNTWRHHPGSHSGRRADPGPHLRRSPDRLFALGYASDR
jgi:hypothetical protein